ncbi:MAG TPA: SRPBCC family protein [Rhodanobacteraceae bacterium]
MERKSNRELLVTRTFDAPVHLVFRAWSVPDLFKLWWVPKSTGMSLVSCAMDIRTGGTYRLEFRHPSFDQPMAFFGTYREVTPKKRIVWTNEEGDQGAVTTVTFEADTGKTLVTFHELYPTEAALNDALAGSAEGLTEQFAQLDELLAGKS